VLSEVVVACKVIETDFPASFVLCNSVQGDVDKLNWMFPIREDVIIGISFLSIPWNFCNYQLTTVFFLSFFLSFFLNGSGKRYIGILTAMD
jgi:hypothetical protein